MALAAYAAGAHAQYDPAKEYVETPAVAARYPDPRIDIPTPAFKPGRADFTSQEELLAFVEYQPDVVLDCHEFGVKRIATVTERAVVAAHAGDFYVPLDQPLANVIVAALEPETQSSYAANHVLHLPRAEDRVGALLPLYRMPARLEAPALVWDGGGS